MTTFPILALADGEVLDPQWIADITAAVNDHENRVDAIEVGGLGQLAYTTNGTMASSTGTEVAMTAWTGGASPTFVFRAGYVHELVVQCGGFDSTVAATAGRANIRVRKGVNTTSGQQLALIYLPTIGNSSSVTTIGVTRYVKNATGA